MGKIGVIPRQMLRTFLSLPYVGGVDEKYLNPASIDLPLSDEAYRLVNAFLPKEGQPIRSYLNQAGAQTHPIDKMLEVGVSYLVRVAGTWKLPQGVYGYANPKSSSGRIFLSTRVLGDQVGMYDALTAEWSGEMWVMVSPERFPVIIYPGMALTQLRLFDGEGFLDSLAITVAIEKTGLLFDEDQHKILQPRRHRDSLFLSLHVGEDMGWECRGTNQPLDLNRRDHDPLDFFQPISVRNGAFDLRMGTTYILATRERVMVPPEFSAELRKIDPRFGNFDVHSAGFIDSGWGWGVEGSGRGRPITLEVTPHENMRVEHGQHVARIRYEHMKEIPDHHYDETKTSNYRAQAGPALAKFFKK